MRSRPRPSPRAALVATVGVLTASNVVANRVLPADWCVAWNAMVAGLLYFVARRAGVEPSALGIDGRQLGRGLAVGAAGAVAVGAVHTGVALHPTWRRVFDDARVDGGVAELLWNLVLRIPVGTVVLEEVAFRGVLPALLGRAGRGRWAQVTVPAALFGLWHVLPSADLRRANAAVTATTRDLHPVGSTLAGVVVMGVAGGWLQYLRSAGAHLAAPALVHLTVNDLGFATAWWLRRRRRVRPSSP